MRRQELASDDPALFREAATHYFKSVDARGVRIVVESWTGKVKFGVNEPERIRRALIAGLRERGRPLDLATALEIEQTLG